MWQRIHPYSHVMSQQPLNCSMNRWRLIASGHLRRPRKGFFPEATNLDANCLQLQVLIGLSGHQVGAFKEQQWFSVIIDMISQTSKFKWKTANFIEHHLKWFCILWRTHIKNVANPHQKNWSLSSLTLMNAYNMITPFSKFQGTRTNRTACG